MVAVLKMDVADPDFLDAFTRGHPQNKQHRTAAAEVIQDFDCMTEKDIWDLFCLSNKETKDLTRQNSRLSRRDWAAKLHKTAGSRVKRRMGKASDPVPDDSESEDSVGDDKENSQSDEDDLAADNLQQLSISKNNPLRSSRIFRLHCPSATKYALTRTHSHERGSVFRHEQHTHTFRSVFRPERTQPPCDHPVVRRYPPLGKASVGRALWDLIASFSGH